MLLLRGQMVANARQRRLDEAGAYLARAAALAPDQAARFQQELAASSPAATTTSPTTTPTSTGTSATSPTATTLPATTAPIG